MPRNRSDAPAAPGPGMQGKRRKAPMTPGSAVPAPAVSGPSASTLTGIAAEARVSVSTVSKVLNGRTDVAPATRERVGRLLRRHGYQPGSKLGFGVVDLLLGTGDCPPSTGVHSPESRQATMPRRLASCRRWASSGCGRPGMSASSVSTTCRSRPGRPRRSPQSGSRWPPWRRPRSGCSGPAMRTPPPRHIMWNWPPPSWCRTARRHPQRMRAQADAGRLVPRTGRAGSPLPHAYCPAAPRPAT